MGQPQKFQPIEQQLLRLARKHRREGVSFEAFWAACVDARPMATTVNPLPNQITWPRDTDVRKREQEIVAFCREGWRRAYYRAPQTRREQALQSLALKGLLLPAPRATWNGNGSRATAEQAAARREAIRQALATAPEGLTRVEIQQRTRLPPDAVKPALRKLRERGAVACVPGERSNLWRAL